MNVVFKKSFTKEYRDLFYRQKERVDAVILLFREDPYHPTLKNHPLHGELRGMRAISAGGDLRLVFYEETNHEKAVFLRVGSHKQVY